MAHVVNSSFTEADVQADGSVPITEIHDISDGRVFTFNYNADELTDHQVVLTLRSQRINNELAIREASAQQALNGAIPITKLEFRRRFTFEERMSIDEFNVTYMNNGLLTDEQKKTIRTNLEDYNKATDIVLSDPSTIAGVVMYEQLGLIAQGRAEEILNG
jgi:hypothetical protein